MAEQNKRAAAKLKEEAESEKNRLATEETKRAAAKLEEEADKIRLATEEKKRAAPMP